MELITYPRTSERWRAKDKVRYVRSEDSPLSGSDSDKTNSCHADVMQCNAVPYHPIHAMQSQAPKCLLQAPQSTARPERSANRTFFSTSLRDIIAKP